MSDSIDINGQKYRLTSPAIDISIPLRFNGAQPNAFGVPAATSEPCAAGDLVGDTRRGGSCNFEQYTLIPHCNGTHTECVGHLTDERISVQDCLKDVLIHALLITVSPEPANDTNDTYSVAINPDDRLITRRLLEDALENASRGSSISNAVIVRTAPNDESKLVRRYDESFIPAYFTTEAMQFIVESGFEHLLVDVPSIDRLLDRGRLANHRIFWGVEQGSREANPSTRRSSTVTELIYVPDAVGDGAYLLNLQIAPFASDASPSRPVLFPVIEN